MRKRKNFLPTFLLMILSWLCWLYLLFLTAPNSKFLLFAFYFLLFFSFFLTFSLVFANSRRGFLIAAGLAVTAFLQQIKLLNILNVLLLGSILFLAELFFSHR